MIGIKSPPTGPLVARTVGRRWDDAEAGAAWTAATIWHQITDPVVGIRFCPVCANVHILDPRDVDSILEVN